MLTSPVPTSTPTTTKKTSSHWTGGSPEVNFQLSCVAQTSGPGTPSVRLYAPTNSVQAPKVDLGLLLKSVKKPATAACQLKHVSRTGLWEGANYYLIKPWLKRNSTYDFEISILLNYLRQCIHRTVYKVGGHWNSQSIKMDFFYKCVKNVQVLYISREVNTAE